MRALLNVGSCIAHEGHGPFAEYTVYGIRIIRIISTRIS
jgi:hypothetical protein